jgi:hypothetical protein
MLHMAQVLVRCSSNNEPDSCPVIEDTVSNCQALVPIAYIPMLPDATFS